MARGLASVLLFVAAAWLHAAPLRAQCTPAVQRLISERAYDEARVELRGQLTRAATDDAAMDCMGRLLLAQGQSGDAIEWLEKAVKINGRSAPHQLWLGNALRDEVQQAAALRQPFLARRMKAAYDQAALLDPALVDAHHWLAMFYANAPGLMGGSTAKAREQAAVILTLDPMRGHVDYATIAEREQDYAGAERELFAAIAAMPEDAIPYDAAAAFYRRRQRWADAIAIYEKLLNARPDAANAHLSLGRIYIHDVKQYERGEKEVRLWLANQPKDASPANISNAHYSLGLVLQQNGRRDQARAEYAAALAANPRNMDAKKAIGSAR